MPKMRPCRSCTGPIPRASLRCPWCKSTLATAPGTARPHEAAGDFVLPPPDLFGRD